MKDNKVAQALEKRIRETNRESKHIASLLWGAIKERASSDAFYKADVLNWLNSPNYSTVFFRDVVCSPFENLDYDTSMYDPHFNAWAALDSWVYNLRSQVKFMFPEIELGNDLKLTFSHFCNFANPVYFGETSKGRIRFTIIDDEIYTMTADEEPCTPIKKEYQPALFKQFTYDFFKGNFVKKASSN